MHQKAHNLYHLYHKNVLFQNVLEELNKVSPENVTKIKLDEMKSNDKLLNRKRYDDIFSIYKTPRKVNKKYDERRNEKKRKFTKKI